MRKHIIRVLTLVLFACFGLAIMTACNKDNKKPNDQTYTVTYVAGGGTGTAPQSESHKEGEKFNLQANPFTKDGQIFAAWNDGSKDYAAGAEYTMPAKDVTFTAKWKNEQVTVTYSLGENINGSVPVPSKADKGAELELTAGPEWEGHLFTGWKIGDTAEVKKAGEKITVTANITLTAQYKAVSFEIEDVTLEVPTTADKMFFVITGTLEGYTLDEFKTVVNKDSADDKACFGLWGVTSGFADDLTAEVTLDGSNWTVKYDITELETGHYYPVSNRDGGDIAWGEEFSSTTLTVNSRDYEVTSRTETSGEFVQLIIGREHKAGEAHAFTGAELTTDEDGIYLTVKGTHEGFGKEFFKQLLEDTDLEELAFHIFLAGGDDGKTWTSQNVAPVYTVEDETFEVKFEISSLANGVYQIGEDHTNDADIKGLSNVNSDAKFDNRAYNLRGTADNLRLTVAKGTYAFTKAEIAIEEEHAILKVSGTYERYEADEVQTAFNFSLYSGTYLTITVNVTAADGEFTVSVDVTDLGCTSYNICTSQDGYGDIKSFPGINVSEDLNGKSYRLGNDGWGNLILTIVDISKTYEITGMDLTVDNDASKVYLTISGTLAGYEADELKTILESSFYFWGNTAGRENATSAEATISGNTWSLKLDVTNLKVEELRNICCNGQDLKETCVQDKTVELGDYRYTLQQDNGATWHNNGLKVEFIGSVSFSDPTFAGIETADDRAYFVIKGTYTGDATEDVAKTHFGTQDAYPFEFYGTAGTLDKQARSVSIDTETTTWILKFDVTELPNCTYYCRYTPAKDFRLELSKAPNGEAEVVGMKLTFTNYYEYGNDDADHYYGCLILKVERPYTTTNATLEAVDDKPYFVISGTHTGDVDKLKAAFQVLHFEIGSVTTFNDRIVDVQADTWTLKLGISEFGNGGYITRFGPYEYDLKLDAEHAVPGTTITVGGKVYTLRNTPSGGASDYWGCVAIEVADAPVEKTFKPTEVTLEVTDESKVFLVIKANITGYTEEQLKTFVYVGEDESDKIDVATVTIEGGVATLKIDFTSARSAWWWGHYTIEGGEKIDLRVDVVDTIQKVGERTYYLFTHENGITILQIEPAATKIIKFMSAELKQEEDGKVYLVVTALFAGYTQVDFDGIVYLGDPDNHPEMEMNITQAIIDGSTVTLKFNFTSEQVSNNWWWGNIQIGDKTEYIFCSFENKEITSGGYKYELFHNGDSQQVIVTVKAVEA